MKRDRPESERPFRERRTPQIVTEQSELSSLSDVQYTVFCEFVRQEKFDGGSGREGARKREREDREKGCSDDDLSRSRREGVGCVLHRETGLGSSVGSPCDGESPDTLPLGTMKQKDVLMEAQKGFGALGFSKRNIYRQSLASRRTRLARLSRTRAPSSVSLSQV